jgi:hypothetical protein
MLTDNANPQEIKKQMFVFQNNRTNKMHLFAFSLLRLTASICFEHLFAYHQEALYIQQLAYFQPC